MKMLPYNLIFKVILIFLLVALPTVLTQRYSNFTYTEISTQSNLTGSQPYVLVITHYQDSANTSIVRVGRMNYLSGTNRCFEQRLLLRVLQSNGSVIPINFD